jgi:hypothetical protein
LILLVVDYPKGKNGGTDLAVFIKIPCDEHGVQVAGSQPVATLATDIAMYVDMAILDQARFWNVPTSKTWKPQVITGYDSKNLIRYALFRIPRLEGVSERSFNKTVLESIQDAGMRFNIMTLSCHES